MIHIPAWAGFMFLTVVIDAFSRKAWAGPWASA